MYLFAFMFLILSLLGLYTQIYISQTNRYLTNQKTIGQNMVNWHVGGVSFARKETLSGTLPCDPGAAGSCSSGTIASSGYLSSDDSGSYIWKSLIFKVTGESSTFVVTYVPSTAVDTTTKLITSPDIGITLNELSNQLRKSTISSSLLGYVTASGSSCILHSLSGIDQPMVGGSGCPTIPSGSLAIISLIQ